MCICVLLMLLDFSSGYSILLGFGFSYRMRSYHNCHWRARFCLARVVFPDTVNALFVPNTGILAIISHMWYNSIVLPLQCAALQSSAGQWLGPFKLFSRCFPLHICVWDLQILSVVIFVFYYNLFSQRHN